MYLFFDQFFLSILSGEANITDSGQILGYHLPATRASLDTHKYKHSLPLRLNISECS